MSAWCSDRHHRQAEGWSRWVNRGGNTAWLGHQRKFQRVEQELRLAAADVHNLVALLVLPSGGQQPRPSFWVHGGEEISREGKFQRGASDIDPVCPELQELIRVDVGEGEGDLPIELHVRKSNAPHAPTSGALFHMREPPSRDGGMFGWYNGGEKYFHLVYRLFCIVFEDWWGLRHSIKP